MSSSHHHIIELALRIVHYTMRFKRNCYRAMFESAVKHRDFTADNETLKTNPAECSF